MGDEVSEWSWFPNWLKGEIAAKALTCYNPWCEDFPKSKRVRFDPAAPEGYSKGLAFFDVLGHEPPAANLQELLRTSEHVKR